MFKNRQYLRNKIKYLNSKAVSMDTGKQYDKHNTKDEGY